MSPASMYAGAAVALLVGVVLVLVVAREPGDRPRALAVMVPAGLVWYAGVWAVNTTMFMAGMGYLG